MSTWILAEPIFIITSWDTEIKLLDSTYTGMNVNFFFPQNGEKITKKVQTFLWELTLPAPSVCMGQWWQGSLVRPPSWKTWSLSWGNIEEWPPPTRRQVLSRVVGLRRIEKLEGEKGWWPGGWNSLDKGSALTQVGYCSREALNCETSLCTFVGIGIVTKYRLREKLSSLCYGQQGKNQNWRILSSHDI